MLPNPRKKFNFKALELWQYGHLTSFYLGIFFNLAFRIQALVGKRRPFSSKALPLRCDSLRFHWLKANLLKDHLLKFPPLKAYFEVSEQQRASDRFGDELSFSKFTILKMDMINL